MKDPRIEELLDAYGSACTYYGIQVANPNGDNVERAERLKDEAKAKVIAQIEYGMLGQQSDAWSALWKLLLELVPNFWEAKGTGCEKALAAIRQLADKAARPEPAWVANKAAFDAMEDGQGPYMHRKNLEGGVPVEWPAFKSWAENKLGQGYSLACCEGSLVDSVTSWCFTGFQAGMEYAGTADSMRFIGDDDHHYTGPNDKEAVVALLRDVVRDIRAWGSTGLFSAAEKLAMLADRFERGHLRELVQQKKFDHPLA